MRVANFIDTFIVDFRRSELTNYTALAQKSPKLKTLGKQDIVCLRNSKGDNILFVNGFYLFNAPGSKPAKYLVSTRLRLLNGAICNEALMADYGRQVGIKFENLENYNKRVKEFMAALQRALKDSLLGKRRKAA